MKYLKTYRLFESGISDVIPGSLAEEVYYLFIDYAEKYDINWRTEEGGFGFNDDISEFIIAESSECVVLDISFQKRYKVDEEFHRDMVEFTKRLQDATGYKSTISHEGNNKEYNGSRLYQIAIYKKDINEGNKDFDIIKDPFDDIKEDVSDITRDCQDLGINISIQKTGPIPTDPLIVRISAVNSYNQPQLTGDLRYNIEHLVGYMKSLGYTDFAYVDSMSEFNYLTYRNNVQKNNILPPDDNSRYSYIGSAQIIFKKL